MRCRTIAAPGVVARTVEIFDVAVALIEVIPEVVAAVGADEKAAEHILLAVFGRTLAGLGFASFLNLLPCRPVYDGFMHIFKDCQFGSVFNSGLLPVFLGVLYPVFQLEVDGEGLVIHYRPGILSLRKNLDHG
jgi:hypothetical protein